jgi:hypothetical protein
MSARGLLNRYDDEATHVATNDARAIGLQDQSRARKQRLSSRAIRHAERLQSLPKTAQRFVIEIIDVLEERGGHVRRHSQK